MTEAKLTIDLTRIDEKEFDPQRPLRIATMRGGKIIDQKTITPAKEKNARGLVVHLSLGPAEDGVAGAEVVVAPADDERNLFSKLAARRFVTSTEGTASIIVHPGIYRWWRFCWFPRRYHVTGRLLRHVGDCAHPIAGAKVEIYDVDYCWWWYSQDLLTSVVSDVNGFFDISFTWCVPLWCLFEIVRKPPLVIDPDLRDRLRAAFEERVVVKFPPPPPPPDPWTWESQLADAGIELPPPGRPAGTTLEVSRTLPTVAGATAASRAQMPAAAPRVQTLAAASRLTSSNAATALSPSTTVKAVDIFGPIIFWPPCDEPCDWLPDIKIRVTQAQPGGTVVIYEDSYAQIHFNQVGDLLNLTLEANASALYADDCHPDPILGNCMLLDAVGTIKIAPTSGDARSGIYQPDVTPGVSYGVTPDRRQRLGYGQQDDRPFARTVSVYGRFGIAAHVDYYQVQVAKWTNADLLAWDSDHTHVPPDTAFAPVPGTALVPFSRSFLEESPLPLHWASETFGPNTVATVPLLWKTRERFQTEYKNSHAGTDPAPDFGGWNWYYFTETRLFDLDTSNMSNGYYTFRFICYHQTGVDASGNPILVLAPMGLPGGVGKRCTTSKPELLTLYLHDDAFIPKCKILSFTRKDGTTVDECALVTLTPTDYLDVEYQAFDAAGNLDAYSVTLQKGFTPEHDLLTLAGVTAVAGSAPEGPTYQGALVDPTTPAIPPYWFGGAWKKRIDYATFVAMGGSCAYNLRVTACDRQTDGFSDSCALGYCDENRAFTIILAP